MAGMKAGKPGTGQLGCAVAIVEVLALLLGFALGRYSPRPSVEQARDVRSTKSVKMRNVFSPDILGDPAVKDQHARIVEELERACAQQRQHCEEAASARQWLQSQEER